MYRWKTSKDGIILINYFNLKFKVKSIIKTTIKSMSGAVLRNICLENFLQLSIFFRQNKRYKKYTLFSFLSSNSWQYYF